MHLVLVKIIIEIQNYKTKAELKRTQSAPAAGRLASDLRKNKINKRKKKLKRKKN